MRKFLHVDMDAFFASVEQRDDPALRGRPVIVGGSPSGRGVVAAASYEARASGVRSAMPAARAARLCPDAVFVRPRFERYREVSRQMRTIFQDYTDLIEPVSLDEAYLDVTTNKAGLTYARQVAQRIRARIRDELGLTASAGVAPIKFVAKIASDHRKPDGLTVIPPAQLHAFLSPLPVRALPGVGPATEARLHALGLRTIAELREAGPAPLHGALGSRGGWLLRLAHGDDPRGVVAHRERHSRGAERTFGDDLRDASAVHDQARALLCRVVDRLRAADEQARTVTLKLRYADFQTVSRSRTLAAPTDRLALLTEVTRQLLAEPLRDRRPIRLVGVALSQLCPASTGPTPQLPLFEVAPSRSG